MCHDSKSSLRICALVYYIMAPSDSYGDELGEEGDFRIGDGGAGDQQ